MTNKEFKLGRSAMLSSFIWVGIIMIMILSGIKMGLVFLTAFMLGAMLKDKVFIGRNP